MKPAMLKRLEALEVAIDRVDRKPIALIDVTEFDPEDRDAYLDGDDSVLTRYGFEPSLSHMSAIVISVHPDRRDEWDEISELDDEQLEAYERRAEMEDRRRKRDEAERAQREAIQAARAPEVGYDYSGYPIEG